MPADIREYCVQSSDPDWRMVRNGHVVLCPFQFRLEPHVAACLTCDLISEALEKTRELKTIQITRKLHAEITSS